MDIKKLSIEQLKAMSYDELIKIEISRKNLELLNQELTARNNDQVKPQEEKKK